MPIVFVGVIDPVGSGLIRSMSRPGGNATGFVPFEYSLAAKWLQLLKEIAPNVTRVAVLRDPSVAAGIGQFAAIQAVGLSGMELSALDLRDAQRSNRPSPRSRVSRTAVSSSPPVLSEQTIPG